MSPTTDIGNGASVTYPGPAPQATNPIVQDLVTVLRGGVFDDPNQLKLRQGVVAAVNASSVDVTIGASTTVPGVRFLDSYAPVAGDTVWLLRNGPDALVIGAVAASSTNRQRSLKKKDGVGKSTTSSAYTPCAAAVADCGLVFVAPPSGVIEVSLSALMRSQVAAKYCRVDYNIRNGATIGAGTMVYSGDTSVGTCLMATVSTDFHRGAGFDVYSGLTPGATYNIYAVMASHDGVSNVSVAGTSLVVTPSP